MTFDNPLLRVFPDNDDLGVDVRMIELYVPLDHETNFFRLAPVENAEGGRDLVIQTARWFGKIEGGADPQLFDASYVSGAGAGLGQPHNGFVAEVAVLLKNISLSEYDALADHAQGRILDALLRDEFSTGDREEACRQDVIGQWKGNYRFDCRRTGELCDAELHSGEPDAVGYWQERFSREKLAAEMAVYQKTLPPLPVPAPLMGTPPIQPASPR